MSSHDEDLLIIFKLHEIIKTYEFLVEHLLTVRPVSNKEAELLNALDITNGNILRAAKLLNIPVTTFCSRMRKYGIKGRRNSDK